MSLEDTPDHQEKCYDKRQHLTQLDSRFRVSVVSCLRRLIVNLDNTPVILAPLLELEQIRLGPAGCGWGGPDEDRSEEVAALRNRRLTVIMPQLESISILATMNFISMWVLPEEAGRFRYDSEHIVGDTLRCPIRARLCTLIVGDNLLRRIPFRGSRSWHYETASSKKNGSMTTPLLAGFPSPSKP